MPSYRMACPIARSLDRLGDRWNLLILRDLHAGPMRFGEISDGIPGLATNLLSSRLDDLLVGGLVTKDGPHYALTDQGRRTDAILWELARFGMALPPEDDLRPTGHLRLIAITLQSGLRSLHLDAQPLVAELVVDDTPFTIDLTEAPTVTYGAPAEPRLRIAIGYESLLAAGGGEIPLEELAGDQLTVTGETELVERIMGVFQRLMTEAFAAAPPASP